LQLCIKVTIFFNYIVVAVVVVVFVAADVVVYGSCGSSALTSDLSLTNSFATSSVVRCDKILMIVQPVSSSWIRRPSVSQQAHDPLENMVQHY